DSYASGMRSFYDDDRHKYATARAHDMRPPTPDGLKPKDLIGTPWRVAFALQADGWWLRSAITWAKGISFLPGYSGSVMPESVDDRPTRASEMVFLLAKSERYFVDMDAIREPIAESSIMRINQATLGLRVRQKTADNPHFGGRRQAPEPGEPNAFHPLGRNVRDVWAINPEPFDYEMCRVCKRVYDGREYEMLADAPRDGDALPKKVCRCGRSDEWLSHFAVFPQALVLPCVLAGTSEKGCCPQCGAPWERVVEGKSEYAFNIRVRDDKAGRTDRKSHFDRGVNPDEVAAYDERSYGGGGRATIGWRPTCPCGVEETIPATVLDPFAGSGTTLLVAAKNGRHSVGVELQNDYIPLIQKRLEPLETDLIHPAKVVIVECPTTDTTERRYTTGDALPATSPLSPGEKTECTARGDATG
ncbi:MAG TPA: DNA methyltransferase, partial [Gemmatimonadales bacterium]|nr:DNA methyltransferase [Gemmatimonadales bacterium]